MASTTTPLLGLYKATPGTNEPFRTTDLNGNWDLLDTVIDGYETRVVEIEEDSAALLAEVEVALESLSTESIILAIDSLALDVDGGTA